MGWRGALLALTIVAATVVFVGTIYPFLAISRPVGGDVLVVEAWIWRSHAMREASEVFARGRYQWIVTVGETIDGYRDGRVPENSAEAAAGELRALGVDETRIIVLAVPRVTFHHTYASALTLRSWLRKSHIEARGVDVFTLGPHARKSLVVFQRALEPETPVGVIAGTEDTFDPQHWWLSWRGIAVMVDKIVGYLYAIVWPLPKELSAVPA
jgi:hypothetical protein